jgi:hypothetical protein
MKNVNFNEVRDLIERFLIFTADVELDKINTQIADLLRGLELRKRSYFVNMPNLVYVIGMKRDLFFDAEIDFNRRIFI